MAASKPVVVPIGLRDAGRFVKRHHRHSPAPKMARYALALMYGPEVLAVAIVGNPKAAGLQNGLTFEVLRVANIAPPKVSACSRLYAACARSALAMGFQRGVTYTREDEHGSSLRASGWWPTARVDGREWNTGNKRDRWLPGLYIPTSEIVDRVRWEIGPAAAPEHPDLMRLGRRTQPAGHERTDRC